MIGYDIGMHQAGVLLHLLLLACRAGAMCRRVLVLVPMGSDCGRSPCGSPTAQAALANMAEMCFRISSGCRAGASPANGEHGNRSGCPTNRRDCDCSTRRKAEREREGSAARSIRRTKMRRAGRCRVTAAQQFATNTQRTRPPERENSHRRIWHHCVPNLLFSQKRQRAGFCSTAPARIVLFVSQAWNGMGIRFVPCRFPLRPPRTRNDSRPRSMNRS